jgi:hypothetical protein
MSLHSTIYRSLVVPLNTCAVTFLDTAKPTPRVLSLDIAIATSMRQWSQCTRHQ